MNSLQQSSSEEFVASRISKSPTGRIRLLESIPERKNMQRALHFARYVDDCVIFVRSERGGKRVMNFPSFGLVFPWTRSCLISRTATYGPVRVVVWEGRPARGVPIPMCAGQIRLLNGDVNIRKEMTHEVNKVQTQPDGGEG